MAHEFLIMVDGVIKKYTNFSQIPEIIDHVIKFSPEYPGPPHTDQQHLELESWTQRLQELVQRERNASCS